MADRFGRHNVGIVYGWVFAAHMFGAAIAAWAAGVVSENVGDYAAAFVAAGWIAIVAGFAGPRDPPAGRGGTGIDRTSRGGRGMTGKRS